LAVFARVRGVLRWILLGLLLARVGHRFSRCCDGAGQLR
jgi:hypothetical protein